MPFAASAVRLFVEFVEGSIYTHVLAARSPHLKYVDEGKIPKNRDLGIFCHARHGFGYQGRELDLCDGDGQRGDGAGVSNRSCNRITRSILSSYPPRFFALATFSSSFLLRTFYSLEHFYRSGRIQPLKFAKRSDRRRILDASSFNNNLLFFLLSSFYSISFFFHFKSDPSRVRRLVTIKFHVFPFMKFLLVSRHRYTIVQPVDFITCLHYCSVRFLFTQSVFFELFLLASSGNTIETIRATC